MTYVNEPIYTKKTVLIPRKGSLKNIFYVENGFWNVDTIFYTEINEERCLPKYLFYCLRKMNLENLNQASGIPSLTQEKLNDLKILVPPLHVQEHIVSVLDKFEELINDSKAGLLKEIELRQKQYEYYREQLFNFGD